LTNLVAQGRFQHDSMTVTKKWVFPHVSWKNLLVHAKHKERAKYPTSSRHGIQYLYTLVPPLFDGDARFIQHSLKQLDPLLPREISSERVQLQQSVQSRSDQQANLSESCRLR